MTTTKPQIEDPEIQILPTSDLMPSWFDSYIEKGMKIPHETFQESWLLTLHDTKKSRAFWIKFSLLSSSNWFRRIADVSVWIFEKNENGETTRSLLKQSYDISMFRPSLTDGSPGFSASNCTLTEQGTQGRVRSKGRSLRWNFVFSDLESSAFSHSYSGLSQMGIVKNQARTSFDRLLSSGTLELDGVTSDWKNCTGTILHQYGNRHSVSWTRVHCAGFRNAHGEPTDFSVHGVSARSLLFGLVKSPVSSSFAIRYGGEQIVSHRLRDAFLPQTSQKLDQWKFQVNKGPLSFRGEVTAQLKDFAGLTVEDTDGTFLYCADAGLADLTIHVYRKGSLENSFVATNGCTFEVVSREKSQYINYQS